MTYETVENCDSMPSLKHSLVQTNIAGMLFNDTRFSTFIELSLDASPIDFAQFGLKIKDELIPDVCAYLTPPLIDDRLGYDAIRVSQYPDLVVEVLSPTQVIGELLRKIDAYFALGIKSCWLAIPSLEEIRIFSQPTHSQAFDINDSEVIDLLLNIRCPIGKLFGKKNPLPLSPSTNALDN